MTLTVPVVNAFVAAGAGGNPAGVVLDAAGLSDQQMQQIAHQVGASETAFVIPANDATHRLRFFTPTVEVNLCGHATIATWSLMRQRELHTAGDYTQRTLAGLIHMTIDESNTVFMEQPDQVFGPTLDTRIVADGLGITPHLIAHTTPPQIVQQNLMLGLPDKSVLNALNLDMDRIIALGDAYGFSGLHCFALLAEGDAAAAVRDYAPQVGIPEDAATGTTNGSFLTYLRHYDLLPDQAVYKIEQGEAMGSLSHIFGKFVGDKVWIGGQARATHELSIDVAN